MQIQQSIASLVGGAIDEPGNGGRAVSIDAPPPPDYAGRKHGDRIRRSPFPSWPSTTGTAGGLTAILCQLMRLLQQLLSALGGGGQSFFNTAQGSSVGDPHLAFNGTSASGTQQSQFDSMDAHPDLLDSSSFQGGFQIGTAVTQPNANGVTWNRRAAVTTDFGSTRVSLDNNGQARIFSNGQYQELAAGQSMQLGSNETVTRNTDGSLVISDKNDSGGYVTTTLRDNGPGVDVNVDANSVALDGDLVRQT